MTFIRILAYNCIYIFSIIIINLHTLRANPNIISSLPSEIYVFDLSNTSTQAGLTTAETLTIWVHDPRNTITKGDFWRFATIRGFDVFGPKKFVILGGGTARNNNNKSDPPCYGIFFLDRSEDLYFINPNNPHTGSIDKVMNIKSIAALYELTDNMLIAIDNNNNEITIIATARMTPTPLLTQKIVFQKSGININDFSAQFGEIVDIKKLASGQLAVLTKRHLLLINRKINYPSNQAPSVIYDIVNDINIDDASLFGGALQAISFVANLEHAWVLTGFGASVNILNTYILNINWRTRTIDPILGRIPGGMANSYYGLKLLDIDPNTGNLLVQHVGDLSYWDVQSKTWNTALSGFFPNALDVADINYSPLGVQLPRSAQAQPGSQTPTIPIDIGANPDNPKTKADFIALIASTITKPKPGTSDETVGNYAMSISAIGASKPKDILFNKIMDLPTAILAELGLVTHGMGVIPIDHSRRTNPLTREQIAHVLAKHYGSSSHCEGALTASP
ncbi:MAG: hypothetical protein HY072_05490 [Deltaproteobacteria bacterium]|nr:hypothetical protein [Deltaproteobacteria bacterium]